MFINAEVLFWFYTLISPMESCNLYSSIQVNSHHYRCNNVYFDILCFAYISALLGCNCRVFFLVTLHINQRQTVCWREEYEGKVSVRIIVMCH